MFTKYKDVPKNIYKFSYGKKNLILRINPNNITSTFFLENGNYKIIVNT